MKPDHVIRATPGALIQCLINNGWTNTDIAEKIGVTRGNLRHMTRGTQPGYIVMDKLRALVSAENEKGATL